MEQTVVVFASAEIDREVSSEVGAIPGIEGRAPVAVALPPDFLRTCPRRVSADGRVALIHSFSEEEIDWLAAYLAEYIADGRVQIMDALPADWQYPAPGVA